jgi:hypothetical protein
MSKTGNAASAVRAAVSTKRTALDKDSPFYVPPFLDVLGRAVGRFRHFWLWLGDIESMMLSPQISQLPIRQPIYVCGLARSGSTLLHEIVTSHASVATHRLKDYPFVSTPYWWRRASAFIRPTPARERPHRDKMMVNSESPDSIEEMLWMAFFPGCHDPNVDNRLQYRDRNKEFDAYYLNHLRKLLLVEKAVRYAAKANHHVARLEYLLRLFPDAKFVIPVRAPAGHIASLIRQHRWFSSGHGQSPQSLAVMQRSGHFEFGLDRRPINLGDSERVKRIRDAWSGGNEILGWARYWDMIYRYLAELLESHREIRKAAIVVRFEELCRAPAEIVQRVLEHCNLPDAKPVIETFARIIRPPDYYKISFTSEELGIISAETAGTAQRWGVES